MDSATFYFITGLLCACVGGLVVFVLNSFHESLKQLRSDFETCRNRSMENGTAIAEKIGEIKGRK